jgi:hypothetical protein
VELVPEPVQGVLRLPQVDRVGPQVTLVILGYGDCYTMSYIAYIEVKRIKYRGKNSYCSIIYNFSYLNHTFESNSIA